MPRSRAGRASTEAPKGVILETDAPIANHAARDLHPGRPQPRHAAGQRHRDDAGRAGADRRLVRKGLRQMSDRDADPRPHAVISAQAPTGADDAGAYRYYRGRRAAGARRPDRRGGRLCRGGAAGRPGRRGEIDHRPHLILPGFIDTHIHFPQMQVIGSYARQLLEWLNTYTFPEETPLRRHAACAAHRAACSSTSWCATARPRRGAIARCIPSRPTPSSPRRTSATCGWSPAR